MSTKERTGSAGRTVGIVIILLCLAGLACLGIYLYRQQLPPPRPETAIGYVASDGSSAPVYDIDSGEMLGVLVRGSQVAYVPADLEQPREDGRVRIVSSEDSYVLLDAARLTDDPAKTVQVDIVYALRGMSLLDETGAVPGCAVEKGMALTVIGFDGLDADGNVLRWKVSCDRGEGYIADANIRMTEPEAQAPYDEALYQLHAARGDSWGGGDAAAMDTMEGFRANVQKLKDAGYYLIGRITVFNDAHLAADHPEYVISDLDGTPLKISSMYWPSAYNRTVWQYKVDLALEAASLGFNEIQFDYIRFPDGAYRYEKAGTIDYRNTYGESKAQAVQRFLLYAAERLHGAGYYLSGDVFGECANPYVTACGQYWPAISAAVDAISGMPYPDHYSAQGDYKPWEHPYDTVHMFGAAAAERQKETVSPAAVRTWIQAYNALWEPYNTYGAAEIAAEVKALRDTGCTGGFMTWNGGSDINKYQSIISALR